MNFFVFVTFFEVALEVDFVEVSTTLLYEDDDDTLGLTVFDDAFADVFLLFDASFFGASTFLAVGVRLVFVRDNVQTFVIHLRE